VPDAATAGRPLFDAHVHVERGLDGYGLATAGKNVIFNEVASYRAHAGARRAAGDRVTLVLDLGADREFVAGEARAGRVDALKVHSRIQRLAERDWEAVYARIGELPAELPIVVDAFYFGKELAFQPRLPAIAELLARFPERRVVVAHSGGYRVLEYFFHLREFENCYYELALSLQYLEDSSAMLDLKKLVRFTDRSRIVWGSDYPFGSPVRQLEIFLELCRGLRVGEDELHRMLFANANALFARGASDA